jgi:hypothetical protein
MKTPMTLALGLLALAASAQPFNNTYDVNANSDVLITGFTAVDGNNESISVSNGTDGSSHYYMLTKHDPSGGVVFNTVVRGCNSPFEGFTHVKAISETPWGEIFVAGYYHNGNNPIIEQPFLACFDQSGVQQWNRVYYVNQNPIVRADINKISLCPVNDGSNDYFIVAAGDSPIFPGQDVSVNVLKVDMSGNMISSFKYFNASPPPVKDVREYPGDIEYSISEGMYMITGHKEFFDEESQLMQYRMFYFGIDHNANMTTSFQELHWKDSRPIDQDMVYDKNTDQFATTFTHENSNIASGVKSFIGFINLNLSMNHADPGIIWHPNGITHNGRSISHHKNGTYVICAGTLDNQTWLHNPVWQEVSTSGTPNSPFFRYNVQDDVYFGHHATNSNQDEFVLINEHKTDLRVIRTDISGKACGVKKHEPIYKPYKPEAIKYKYKYEKQDGMKKYEICEKQFKPKYRKCEGEGDHYRLTGIAEANAGNHAVILYPSVMSSQQAILNLENNTGANVRVEVRNLTGQLIFSTAQIGSGKHEINLGAKGDLATGIYLVNTFDANGQLANSSRIVVNQ